MNVLSDILGREGAHISLEAGSRTTGCREEVTMFLNVRTWEAQRATSCSVNVLLEENEKL